MPHLRNAKTVQPLAKLWDMKAQKNGLRRTVFSVNGDEYTGEWQDNKRHGNGSMVWKESATTYDGEWRFGQREGHGTYSKLCPETNQYVRLYAGGWKNGKHHGYGTYFYSTGGVYRGEWNAGQRSGRGRMDYDNGEIYEGVWLHDKQHGPGVLQLVNGNRYEGEWRDGKKNGHGRFLFPARGQVYEGLWVDGVCRCGTLSDGGRDQAPMPTKWPIPKVELLDSPLVLMEAQATFFKLLL